MEYERITIAQFPIEVGEQITTPLLVTDVLRNGIPELVVGTAARSVHVLDGRGKMCEGWPQKVNAAIHNAILHTQWEDDWVLIAHAENSVHSWNSEGRSRTGILFFLHHSYRILLCITSSGEVLEPTGFYMVSIQSQFGQIAAVKFYKSNKILCKPGDS